MSELVIFALGSNLGNRANNINRAIEKIGVPLVRRAYNYHSKALLKDNSLKEWDIDFINTAISCYIDLPPLELLHFIKKIESEMGRVDSNKDWGAPRVIDIDIIFYGSQKIQLDNLCIPHPYMHERDFVVFPVNDICPDFLHPVLNKRVHEIASETNKNTIISVDYNVQ